jgi:hypothetical protein
MDFGYRSLKPLRTGQSTSNQASNNYTVHVMSNKTHFFNVVSLLSVVNLKVHSISSGIDSKYDVKEWDEGLYRLMYGIKCG